MAASSETKKMITLISSDDVRFEVEEVVALESQTIKHMIEDGCDGDVPVQNVKANILAKVIEFCRKHVLPPPPPTPSAKDKGKAVVTEDDGDGDGDAKKDFFGRKVGGYADDELKRFDEEFVNIDQATLFELILAANYLDIKILMDLTCQTVANIIKDMKVEEVRKYFNIKNDFTPEEEAALRKEHEWVFDEEPPLQPPTTEAAANAEPAANAEAAAVNVEVEVNAEPAANAEGN